MVTDIIINSFRKDPTIKRDLIKTITWRLIGSLDTALLGYIITGQLFIGLQIGALELVTKMLLYFLHERVWHRIRLGAPEAYRRKTGEHKQENLFPQSYSITRKDREKLNGHVAYTIWLTGLSGSGKSTIAGELDQWLFHQNMRSYVIDGDNTRLGLNKDLDFSREGREENIRRVAETCRLFNEAGIIVISSFISPFQKNRMDASDIIGKDNFVEVFVDASIEACESRDIKGLYAKARQGKIKDFTGINSPYEPPSAPLIHLQTDNLSIKESVLRITQWISEHKSVNQYT